LFWRLVTHNHWNLCHNIWSRNRSSRIPNSPADLSICLFLVLFHRTRSFLHLYWIHSPRRWYHAQDLRVFDRLHRSCIRNPRIRSFHRATAKYEGSRWRMGRRAGVIRPAKYHTLEDQPNSPLTRVFPLKSLPTTSSLEFRIQRTIRLYPISFPPGQFIVLTSTLNLDGMWCTMGTHYDTIEERSGFSISCIPVWFFRKCKF